VIRVWRAPAPGEAIRYQIGEEGAIFEITALDAGEEEVDGIPGDWPELTP
jgi:hypothetical protein